MEEGDIANLLVFFVQDLGLALATKKCRHRPQPLKQSIMVRLFARKKLSFSGFVINEPVSGTPKHVCTNFHANVRRSDCVRSISSINRMIR